MSPAAAAKAREAMRARRASKVRPVPVSEMRVPPAEVTQRHFKQSQAERYAADFDIDRLGIPVVNRRDGVYWLLDGQHRIAALKMFFKPQDPGSIDCEVYEDLTDAEAADIFLGRDDRRPISQYEKFRVACTAGHQRETDILRTVEVNGLKVSTTQDVNTVQAVSAMGKVYDTAGPKVLGMALRSIKNSYGGDAKSFDGTLIQALGLVYNRYNDRVSERLMVQRLQAVPQGARQLMRRAEVLRERTGTGKSHCLAAVIVEEYNKSLGPRAGARLPDWWKATAAPTK